MPAGIGILIAEIVRAFVAVVAIGRVRDPAASGRVAGLGSIAEEAVVFTNANNETARRQTLDDRRATRIENDRGKGLEECPEFLRKPERESPTGVFRGNKEQSSGITWETGVFLPAAEPRVPVVEG